MCGFRRWKRHGRFPVKTDREVTGKDLARFNLVLLGGPKENALVARMADRLPITIDDDNRLIAGDREPVDLDGTGYRLAYYNPLAPQRLIFLIATGDTGPETEAWLRNASGLLTGSWGHNLGDQPDLEVASLASSTGSGQGGLLRRRMQFTHGWQWRKLPGDTIRAPEESVTHRAMNNIQMEVVWRATGADFAFWQGGGDGQAFDPQWCTLADMATARTGGDTLVCTMTGEELADVHERWLTNDELLVTPELEPGKLDPNREYRIAMPMWMCSRFNRAWKRLLRNVEAGPRWSQEDVWREVFGCR
jgi:hypothetical protein